MQIYSVYDEKSKKYGTPFYQHNGVTAIRSFKMEVNRPDENNVIYRNPEDFTLMHIGEYNEETGEIKGIKPTLVATATSVIQEK